MNQGAEGDDALGIAVDRHGHNSTVACMDEDGTPGAELGESPLNTNLSGIPE